MSTATPTTDTAKYDRQLRLWGEEGQAKLETAHVCLLNGTATGAEIMKNLVLPGIGHFTVVDGHKVQEADTGNNFFITLDTVGKSRAAVVTELLLELNPLVKSGTAVDQDAEALINTNVDFFGKFTVVVATGLSEDAVLKLGKFLYEHNVPLVVARSFGFVGYFRSVVREHTIVESKQDNPFQDLRICEPFPELAHFADSIDLDELKKDKESARYGHVPLVVILAKTLQKWKAEHDGKVPTTRQEKEEFKKSVIGQRRSDGEENFKEAFDLCYKAWTPTKVPSEISDILNDEAAKNLTATSPNFWILASAVREFVQETGFLPLIGSIPDMTADTQTYVSLQNVFNTKAAQDVAAVTSKVHATLQRIGKDVSSISADEIKTFCKNSHFLRVFRTRSLEQEYNPATANGQQLADHFENPTSNAHLYTVLRVVDRFYKQHGRFPGDTDATVEADGNKAKELLEQFLTELKLAPTAVSGDWAVEFTRFGGAELHNIAGFLGGIGAQEAIKLITHQYVPMNNTFIFNGMNCSSTTLQV